MDNDGEKIAQKINLWFRKSGATVYFSHLDLMRHFCRTLRRAGLKPRLTAGFNPRPRLVFPHPMPLGVASDCETAEIEFQEKLPLPEIFRRLRAADGGVTEMVRIEEMRPVKAGNVVAECAYQITGLPETAGRADFAAFLQEMLNKDEIFVTRGHAEKARSVNIRPYLEGFTWRGDALEVRLKHLQEGAGRIDEIARMLAARLQIPWQALTLTKTAVKFRT